MKLWQLGVMVLLLSACGRANEPAVANQPAPPKRESRLVAYEPGQIAKGLEFAQCTQYWTLAEEGNGNALPVKLEGDLASVVQVRIDPDGSYQLIEDGKLRVNSLTEVSVQMHRISQQFWNNERNLSSASMLIAADRRAPMKALHELCRMLVSLQVQNCWLVTADRRDSALRLMPLKIDVVQLEREWYHLTPAEQQVLARLTDVASAKTGASWVLQSGTGGLKARAEDRPGWHTELLRTFAGSADTISRIQFDLGTQLTISQLVFAVDALAPLGFNEVEPWYPALEREPPPTPGREARQLTEFVTKIGAPGECELPGLSEYWRVCADIALLPEPAVLKPDLPSLAVSVGRAGELAVHDGTEAGWRALANSNELQLELTKASGEVDFDLGLSELQVVLYIDRRAPWQSFLEVLEIMHGQRCYRLYLPVWDNLGPTLRLLDLSLPLTELSEHERPASVRIERKGIVDDARYTVRYSDGHLASVHTGVGWHASLMAEVQDRTSNVNTLFITLPRDEPMQTLCTLLNATALLGMQSIRFGG